MPSLRHPVHVLELGDLCSSGSASAQATATAEASQQNAHGTKPSSVPTKTHGSSLPTASTSSPRRSCPRCLPPSMHRVASRIWHAPSSAIRRIRGKKIRQPPSSTQAPSSTWTPSRPSTTSSNSESRAQRRERCKRADTPVHEATNQYNDLNETIPITQHNSQNASGHGTAIVTNRRPRRNLSDLMAQLVAWALQPSRRQHQAPNIAGTMAPSTYTLLNNEPGAHAQQHNGAPSPPIITIQPTTPPLPPRSSTTANASTNDSTNNNNNSRPASSSSSNNSSTASHNVPELSNGSTKSANSTSLDPATPPPFGHFLIAGGDGGEEEVEWDGDIDFALPPPESP